jgi:drug/metabolite transporter (DMT)-like permease
MSPQSRAWIQIHFCVVLWGFTAILGRLITLPALPLVFWRMSLVTLALLLWPPFWAGVRALPLRLTAIYLGIGVLVSLHWVTFYASIKLSNASIAATCMALSSIFVSLIEPPMTRRPFNLVDLGLGIAVLPGVALVVGGTPAGMRTGIAVGAISALLSAVFSVLNKVYIGHSSALAVTGLEMSAGAVLLPLVALLPGTGAVLVWPSLHDGLYLLALAMACTLLPYSLSLSVLRHLSAFATMLAVNLEPVYSILLAAVLLNEQRDLTPRFYLGGALIVVVVLAYPLLSRRFALRRA